MENNEKIKKHAAQILTDYLTKNKMRKTPERYSILEFIYGYKGPFDIETLHTLMIAEFSISKATLYNNIEILEDCGLVTRLQLGGNRTMYEKSLNSNLHYMICNTCGKIKKFSDPNIRRIIQNKHIWNFTTSRYTLALYGQCEQCKKREQE